MEIPFLPIRSAGVWAYDLEPRHYTGAALVLVALLISFRVTTYVAHAIYNVFFNPLRRIPGPVTAAFSELWQLYHQISCKLKLGLRQQWTRQPVASDKNLAITDIISPFWIFS